MFERLVIRGFQRHRKTTVYFDPRITIFVGPTDAGKSSIIRALRWLCFNRAPKNHIHFDCKFASVTLYVDGHKIVRKQGEGVNTYSVDGKELKAFNRGVPDKVSRILKVEPTNFQRQLDSLFWISLPPPKLSKELNRIVDLGVIDSSMMKASQLVKKSKAKVEVTKERLALARKQRKELSWVQDANKHLIEAERLHSTINSIASQAAELQSLLADVSAIESELGFIDKDIEAINKLLPIAKKLDNYRKDIKELENMLSIIKKIKSGIRKNDEDLADIESQINSVKNCPLCGAKYP